MSIALKAVVAASLLAANTISYAALVKGNLKADPNIPESRDRSYQVYVPKGLDKQQAVPMVMVLHGCNETEKDMINDTRFNTLADRDQAIIVYPFITSYDGARSPNCWGFWMDHHIHQGQGEVEDLYRIAKAVEQRYKIDPERRYVVGISSGGAMSVALGVARSEYFAAVGSAEGVPYSETPSSVPRLCAFEGIFRPVDAVVKAIKDEQKKEVEQRVVPIMALHSRNDCVVHEKASLNIRDSWLSRYGKPNTQLAPIDCSTKGVGCTHQKYGKENRSIVETVFYDGDPGDWFSNGSHYWVGDNAGKFAKSKGPSASELFWDFFKRHPFSDTGGSLAETVSPPRTAAGKP